MRSRPLANAASTLGRPVRLLVVDDDPLMRDLASEQLTRSGADVMSAQDGEAAWLLVATEPFDLVLTDLDMPRLDGLGLLARIRASVPHAALPVVMVTVSAQLAAIEGAYAAGANAFVPKPLVWPLLDYQLAAVLRTAAIEADLRAARDTADAALQAGRNLLTLLQHETRTPLNAIIGHSEILAEAARRGGDTASAAGAALVVHSAWQLNTTLRRVFALAQLTAGTLPLDCETIRASALIEESLRARAGSSGRLTDASPPATAPRLWGDFGLLSGALSELLDNALAHAGPAARVTIAWHRLGETVAIEVADDGVGLKPDHLARCRRPFAERGDPLVRETGGLGLGLPTAQAVMDLHGGRFDLESKPGHGTRARLVLPVVPG